MMKAMAMSTPDRDFHIGRGLLHGVLGFLVFLVLDAAFFGMETFSGDGAHELGVTVGKMAGWAFVLALVASYAFQTSRRTLGGLMLLLLASLFVLQLFVLKRMVHAIQALENAASPLTEAEMIRPVPAGSNGRFCQSALAFSFPAPKIILIPDMEREKAMERRIPSTAPHFTHWSWRDPATETRLTILAFKGIENNESSFRSFIAGFKESLSASAASQLGPEEVRWRDEGGEFTISGTNGASARLDMRCLSRGFEDEALPVLVCAQTTVPQGADSLRQVRTGLSLAPCGRTGS